MIKPRPRKYICQDCHWSKIVSPQSDVIRPWDEVIKCGSCGSTAITSEPFENENVLLKTLRKILIR